MFKFENLRSSLGRLLSLYPQRLDILLANDRLIGPGGTEFWTLTMAKALTDMGHNVSVYSPHLGYFAWQYLSPLCLLTDEFPRRKFDLLLINHQTCFEKLRDVRGIKIFTSHSSILKIERFPRGADAYVTISGHIKEIEKKRGFNCEVISNSFDFEKFYSTSKVNKKLKTVFARVGSMSKEAAYLRKVLKKIGVKLITLDETTYDLQNWFNQADLVLALGRELIEAMLCERNVVSMGLRSYTPNQMGAGLISPDNFKEKEFAWFTGRDKPLYLNDEKVFLNELKKYDPQNGPLLRKIVMQNYHPLDVAQKYLNIYYSILNKNSKK